MVTAAHTLNWHKFYCVCNRRPVPERLFNPAHAVMRFSNYNSESGKLADCLLIKTDGVATFLFCPVHCGICPI
jgi:hypothetical protein